MQIVPVSEGGHGARREDATSNRKGKAMTKEIRFKTVLSTLKKGEKPCYRAVPLTNGTTDMDALASGTAARSGLDKALVKRIAVKVFGVVGETGGYGSAVVKGVGSFAFTLVRD